MSDATIRVEHSNRASRIGLAIVSCALVALAAAPWWADRASLRLLSEIYAYVALASLWNLLAGYAGLVSVGQQAYVGPRRLCAVRAGDARGRASAGRDPDRRLRRGRSSRCRWRC